MVIQTVFFSCEIRSLFSFIPWTLCATPSRQILGYIIVSGCQVCLTSSRFNRIFPQDLATSFIHHSNTKFDLLRWGCQPLYLAHYSPVYTFCTREGADSG